MGLGNGLFSLYTSIRIGAWAFPVYPPVLGKRSFKRHESIDPMVRRVVSILDEGIHMVTAEAVKLPKPAALRLPSILVVVRICTRSLSTECPVMTNDESSIIDDTLSVIETPMVSSVHE